MVWNLGVGREGGSVFFSNETFVVCRPGLDDSFQLCAENLILPEALLFFIYVSIIEARYFACAVAGVNKLPGISQSEARA